MLLLLFFVFFCSVVSNDCWLQTLSCFHQVDSKLVLDDEIHPSACWSTFGRDCKLPKSHLESVCIFNTNGSFVNIWGLLRQKENQAKYVMQVVFTECGLGSCGLCLSSTRPIPNTEGILVDFGGWCSCLRSFVAFNVF